MSKKRSMGLYGNKTGKGKVLNGLYPRGAGSDVKKPSMQSTNVTNAGDRNPVARIRKGMF